MAENQNNPNVDDGQGRVSATPSKPRELDIPLLKEKQKERKGAGGWLSGGGAAPGTAGQSVVGATKGGVLAQLFGTAAAGGAKGILAGKLGIAALALGVGGAGLVGYGLLQQKAAEGRKPQAAPQFDAISSSISARKRNAQGSKSLAYMAKAGEGELKWDAGKKDAAAKSEKVDQAEDAADAPASPEDQASKMTEEMMGQMGAGGQQGRERLGGDVGKLSSALGKSNAFGGNSIFSGGTGFQKKDLKQIGAADISRNMKASRGSSTRMRQMKGRMAKRVSTSGIGADRAMGQLKFAGRSSVKAANAGGGSAASAQYAEDAFSGQSTTGGGLSGIGSGGINEGDMDVAPPGGGAPDMTGGGGESMPCASGQVYTADGFCEQPSPCAAGDEELEGGGCRNVTPYQETVDKGWTDYLLWAIVAAAGIALMVWGYTLLSSSNPWTVAAGVALIIVGLILLMLAIMKIMETKTETKQKITDYGQTEQAEIAADAAEPAIDGKNYQGGSNTEDAKRKLDSTKVHDDTMGERDSTYSDR